MLDVPRRIPSNKKRIKNSPSISNPSIRIIFYPKYLAHHKSQ